MRIRVTTSINVRSNTVPSTPALVHDALPEDWNNYIVPEKRNPTSAMPSLESAQSRLVASQRIPKGSRLSAWLHGFSVVGNQQRPTVAHHRKVSHTTTQCYSRTPRKSRTQTRPTGLRPANSTRGVIDPVHSPTTSCWPLSNQSFDDRRCRDRQPSTVEPYAPWTPATASSPHLKSGTQRRKKNLKSSKKPKHTCFPHVNDPKLRHKIFGSLFFGTLLTLVLTTYLALATSNILGGPTFHAVFIFVILVLTIIFSHYLIRLCMLSLHPRKRFGSSNRNKKNNKESRMQWPGDGYTDDFKDDDPDLEAGFARPREPIRVTMVQDEELGGRNGAVLEEQGEEDDAEKELPPPPPAYGLWRSSVRADPNLIHWQSVPPTPSYPPSTLQGETRALVLARNGREHRPPSYVEEDTREVVGGAGGLRTVPAVAERRMVATVDYMRGTGRGRR
ncbi:hypothetical protein JMJ35_008522 [Cladonia borealis]|uniref:Uncharacterized protein n=1 Tax=Cladonia borealis TaxID=184061 RepID=A0AA39QWJ0_9LECA|nr:hypothetical protein JMJ35_008522 [Cladonia borealis]